MNGRVLVVCASRSRPERLEQMIESVANTSTLADVAVYIDEDQVDDYKNVKGRYRVFSGLRVWPCKSIDFLVNDMPGYEAYGAATDDCRFVTPGWDQWVLDTAKSFKSGIGAIAPQTVGGVDRRMDFPWLTGKWIQAWGRFVPFDTQHFYWDVALQLVGEETQIAFATEQEFAIEHDEMYPIPENPKPDTNRNEPITDYGRRVLYAYADAKETCRWIALERRHMVAKIKAAIEEG